MIDEEAFERRYRNRKWAVLAALFALVIISIIALALGNALPPAATSVAAVETSSQPTATATHTPRPTATATHTPRPTATATHTVQPTATLTHTPRPTATATHTPQPTATHTPQPTATHTPQPTATHTPRPTATATHTPRPTATATHTPSPSATPTETTAPPATATDTPQPTATSGTPSLASSDSPLTGDGTPVADGFVMKATEAAALSEATKMRGEIEGAEAGSSEGGAAFETKEPAIVPAASQISTETAEPDKLPTTGLPKAWGMVSVALGLVLVLVGAGVAAASGYNLMRRPWL